jgi:hypothetical protein
MNRLIALAGLLGMTAAPGLARAEFLHANLTGFQEVPSVSTPARGEFRARINKDEDSIDYELTYEGLQGTVSQAHIHFAQRSVNGSIVIWLCGTTTNPGPTGTQTCPQTAKDLTTVKGTITATNVIAANTTSQLILAGELAEVIAALRAGKTYANVHALPLNGGGEIRGQIRPSSRNGDKDKHDDKDR